MSLFGLIAAMGSMAFEFVGIAAHDAGTSGIPLPTGAREGDYCIFVYFPGRTISGGSGTAWTVIDVMTTTAKLAHRRLEPGDITTPLTLSDVSPVCTIVYRGAVGISAERTSASFTGSSVAMTGFTKSANAGAMLGLLHGTGDSASLSMTIGLPWGGSSGLQGPDTWFEALYYLNDMSAYTNGADIGVNASSTSANKYASVIEVLY